MTCEQDRSDDDNARPCADDVVDRDELDRQVRDHYGTWRDRPPGWSCLLVFAVLLLTTALAAYGLVLLIQALR
ncbi:MAG TPA: hypothetical protein VH912_13860 [Streptosporangiaceae bacterium]